VMAPYKKNHTAADASLEDFYGVLEENLGLKFGALSSSDMETLYRSFVRSMKGDLVKAPIENEYNLYGGYDPFIVTALHLANQTAGIGWTTYSHTGVPVPTYAAGYKADTFNGYYDNTALFGKMADAMKIKVQAAK